MVYSRFTIRIAFILTLFVIIFNSIEVLANGCAGDCFSCHPKLVNNVEHRILASCKECHNGKIEVRSSMNMDLFKQKEGLGCGNNCLDCHKEFPKDRKHLVLNKCNDCHKVNLLR